MNWIPVENSPAMSAYAYDPASYTFGVMTPGGTPYFYIDVPPEVHAAFVQAPSKGKFWIATLKPKYQCRKGDGSVAQQSPKAADPVHPKVEKIIKAEGEKASTPLALSTAALDEAVVRPLAEQVVELRRMMSNHCLSIHTEVGELAKLAVHTLVTDEESFTKAAELGKRLADKRKGITSMMQPTKRAIDSVKQVVLDKEKELLGLAEQGENHLDKQCTAYRIERQRKVNAAAENERQQKLREAEDGRIAQAEKAQAAGRTALADKLLSTPVTAPTVKVEQAVPKTSASGRTNWKWRITDVTKVPDEFWMLDESAIGTRVRADKDKTTIPGIEAYPDDHTNF